MISVSSSSKHFSAASEYLHQALLLTCIHPRGTKVLTDKAVIKEIAFSVAFKPLLITSVLILRGVHAKTKCVAVNDEHFLQSMLLSQFVLASTRRLSFDLYAFKRHEDSRR
jgi:hypothetical protein